MIRVQNNHISQTIPLITFYSAICLRNIKYKLVLKLWPTAPSLKVRSWQKLTRTLILTLPNYPDLRVSLSYSVICLCLKYEIYISGQVMMNTSILTNKILTKTDSDLKQPKQPNYPDLPVSCVSHAPGWPRNSAALSVPPWWQHPVGKWCVMSPSLYATGTPPQMLAARRWSDLRGGAKIE